MAGGAANAAVNLAETCIKNKRFKRIDESAGKRINEGGGGQSLSISTQNHPKIYTQKYPFPKRKNGKKG